jgi:hypothetical protein
MMHRRFKGGCNILRSDGATMNRRFNVEITILWSDGTTMHWRFNVKRIILWSDGATMHRRFCLNAVRIILGGDGATMQCSAGSCRFIDVRYDVQETIKNSYDFQCIIIVFSSVTQIYIACLPHCIKFQNTPIGVSNPGLEDALFSDARARSYPNSIRYATMCICLS